MNTALHVTTISGSGEEHGVWMWVKKTQIAITLNSHQELKYMCVSVEVSKMRQKNKDWHVYKPCEREHRLLIRWQTPQIEAHQPDWRHRLSMHNITKC